MRYRLAILLHLRLLQRLSGGLVSVIFIRRCSVLYLSVILKEALFFLG